MRGLGLKRSNAITYERVRIYNLWTFVADLKGSKRSWYGGGYFPKVVNLWYYNMPSDTDRHWTIMILYIRYRQLDLAFAPPLYNTPYKQMLQEWEFMPTLINDQDAHMQCLT